MTSGSEVHPVDPLVVDAVTRVRDRFGIDGLQALVQLATEKLAEAERAAQELREYAAAPLEESAATGAGTGVDDEAGPGAGSGSDAGSGAASDLDPGIADTQAWTAFVQQDPEHDR